ncbi:uncharacterized protein LOC110230972 isoform X2 [Arabidopsis lyrata subsp. lyrata]|uniref:uncharacterized protein LOC110230972 isoform X2 n=1 Tax=Arabidopsis lyrata subsp. lyrata TaxID=81972 RepID=UPI000A29BEF0|nr:uncharacterized protein LOC110230972 isoform X2 [Arabidopsis lyrata subsp. lyrata]|eukprot:XP_020890992.1 uncharacterized protein LOC110230972 isoform X2 [Arabidopsis lyrata subsp. lyrata]
MIFPPSFFTIMVHLTIHLTEEVKLGGPVQFRWMYPIERIFGRFKSYVRNRAQPEGSICEQYIADECLTFCSMYLDDVETRFNRIRRVDDHPVVEHDLGPESEIPHSFPFLGRPVSASRLDTLSPIERQQAHRYILVNSSFLDDYRKVFKSELSRSQLRRRKRGHVIDIDQHVHIHFSQWLKQKVEKNGLGGMSDDMRCLAAGPSSKARLVYYVEDPQEKDWSVVVHVQPRDLYDMEDPTSSDEIPPQVVIEDPPIQSSMTISDNVSDIRLVRQIEDLESSQIPSDLYDNMEYV